jgi:adenylate kinase family enzyme
LIAGDLLREAVKNGNTELEAIMKEGKLVPMEVTIRLLKEAMIASRGKTFLIDGFPRAWDQAECFESSIQPCSAVLFFDCSEEVMRARLLKRGETSGRADDNEATIVKRFRTFVEQSKPVVDEYKTQGKCHDISAMRSPDEVFADVKSALDVLLRGAPCAVKTAAAAEAPPTQTKESKDLPKGSKIVFVLGGPGSGEHFFCSSFVVPKSKHDLH